MNRHSSVAVGAAGVLVYGISARALWLLSQRLGVDPWILQAVLALRARWGDIPVLLASGETDPEKLKDAVASGFPLLHKPVSPEHLRDAVKTLLPVG